jgi:hypothetical protein
MHWHYSVDDHTFIDLVNARCCLQVSLAEYVCRLPELPLLCAVSDVHVDSVCVYSAHYRASLHRDGKS